MKEIVLVRLENEMDLILAHKRAMKLCELTGFSLITQTSIATAVSEIARCAIDYGKNDPPLSAYDEIRRKNLLLQDLAEKIKDSENDYRILTDTLPLMMFSV